MAHFAPSFLRQPNGPECTKIVRNAAKRHFRSDGVFQVHLLRKIPMRLRGTNYCTSSARFAPTFVRQPNGPECTQIVRNASKRQFTVQWGGSEDLLRKIPTRLRGTNFCTSSARFAPSFVRQPNGPEWTQIVQNAQKFQFRVQWGGSGVFVAKNSDTTSWHELLHYFGPFLHRVS